MAGWTPLYTASRNGLLEVVKTLTEAGANINQANKVGNMHCNLLTYIHIL